MPLDTNHYWQENCNYNPGNGSATGTFLQKVIKDSLVNGKIYYFISSYNLQCSPQSNFLVRQDTILKRVIILFNNQEKILYNFNKNVGDTATLLCLLGGVSTYTLTYKDSILLNDGYYHKRFNFGGNGPGNIIEGVGSLKSLFLPYCSGFDTYSTLQCLGQVTPSMTIYSSGGIGTNCPLITDIKINEEIQNPTVIFPNPTNDVINISTGNILAKAIQISNLIGQTILYIDEINGLITTFNLKDFQPGLYLVKVNFADKSINRHFIKN
ncbi:MAG: T9SS type A sorting domain-containing protein [Bacteroidia bacterium]